MYPTTIGSGTQPLPVPTRNLKPSSQPGRPVTGPGAYQPGQATGNQIPATGHRHHGVLEALSRLKNSVKKHLHLGSHGQHAAPSDFTSPGAAVTANHAIPVATMGPEAAASAAPVEEFPFAHLKLHSQFFSCEDETQLSQERAQLIMGRWTDVHALPLCDVINLVLYTFGETTACPHRLQRAYRTHIVNMTEDKHLSRDMAARGLKTQLLEVVQDKMSPEQKRHFQRSELRLRQQFPPEHDYPAYKSGMVRLLRQAMQQARQNQASAPTSAEVELNRAYVQTLLKRNQSIQTLMEKVLAGARKYGTKNLTPRVLEIELNTMLAYEDRFGPWPPEHSKPQTMKAELREALFGGARQAVEDSGANQYIANALYQAIDGVVKNWDVKTKASATS